MASHPTQANWHVRVVPVVKCNAGCCKAVLLRSDRQVPVNPLGYDNDLICGSDLFEPAKCQQHRKLTGRLQSSCQMFVLLLAKVGAEAEGLQAVMAAWRDNQPSVVAPCLH